MASSLDAITGDDKKRRRKNSKPRHLSSYGTKVQTPVQTSETENKNKTDSDGEQIMKKTTSSLEKQLVLEEPVLEKLPIVTPQLRSDQIKDPHDRPEKAKNPESYYKDCVKFIIQLERSGHVESSFRQKFLTWFCLRATNQEQSVVKTFIHSFEDDSVALAEQLVDLFAECLSRRDPTNGVSVGGNNTGSLCKKPRH